MCPDCVMRTLLKKYVLRNRLLTWPILGLCTCRALYLEHPILLSLTSLPPVLLLPKHLLRAAIPACPGLGDTKLLRSSQPLVTSHHIADTTTYMMTFRLCYKRGFLGCLSLYVWASWISRLCFVSNFTPIPQFQTVRQRLKPQESDTLDSDITLAEWAWPGNSWNHFRHWSNPETCLVWVAQG